MARQSLEKQLGAYAYVSSGKHNGMYTLRTSRLLHNGRISDEYVRNLCRNAEEAEQKAIEWCEGKLYTYGGIDSGQLSEWGKANPAGAWERRACQQIQAGEMPFGKYRGTSIRDLPVDYLAFIVSKLENSVVNDALRMRIHNLRPDVQELLDAKQAEEELLHREMRASLAAQVVRRYLTLAKASQKAK